MSKEALNFWNIGTDVFINYYETDSFIYRYYVNRAKKNLGLFYDKLSDKWDAAVVENGQIKTRNIRINKRIHELKFAA